MHVFLGEPPVELQGRDPNVKDHYRQSHTDSCFPEQKCSDYLLLIRRPVSPKRPKIKKTAWLNQTAWDHLCLHVRICYTAKRDRAASCSCCSARLRGSSPHAVSLLRPAASWQPTCPVGKARTCRAAQVQAEEAILWHHSSAFHQVSSRTNAIPKTTPKQYNILNHWYVFWWESTELSAPATRLTIGAISEELF